MPTAAQIWRAYVTDGVSGTGNHKPIKSEIRAWGAAREGTAAGLALLNAADAEAQRDLIGLEGGAAGQQILEAVTMPAIRRLLRNIPDIFDYGGTTSGDNAAAFTAAFASTGVWAETVKELYIPAGNFVVNTAIPAIGYPIDVHGQSMSLSVIKAMHNSPILYYTGQFGTGGSAKRLTLAYDYPGAIGGSSVGLYVQAAAYGGTVGSPTLGYAPDFFIAEDINLTTYNTARFAYGLLIDGSLRHGYVGDPAQGLLGIRNVTARNIIVFNTTTGNAVEVRQGRSVGLSQIAAFAGAGTDNSLVITGSAGFESNVVHINGANVGDLLVEHSSVVMGAAVNCAVLTLAATAANCSFNGNAASISNTGTNNLTSQMT